MTALSMRLGLGFVLGVTCLWCSGAEPAAKTNDMAILEIVTPPNAYRNNPDAVRTIWRYWETWQNEVVKMDSGEVIRVDPYRQATAQRGGDGKVVMNGKITASLVPRKTERKDGSLPPPEGWQNPDFDDSAWFRHEGPMTEGYRSLALVCIRGKFTVENPAKLPELTLNVGFRGGMVVYLNGKEVGRAYLPKGKIGLDTWADIYPNEAYGIAERNPVPYANVVISSVWAATLGCQFKDPSVLARFQKRCRRLEVKIPASLLRKGVNVLALEAHRAPATEELFRTVNRGMLNAATYNQNALATGVSFGCENNGNESLAWNHVMVEDVRLSVPAGATGIIPSIGRPKGLQVWNESVFKRVTPFLFGDPTERLRPVKIRGVKNGTCSGELVVGSTESIKGLKASVTDLKSAEGGTIAASSVQVVYAKWALENQFDALDTVAPAEVSVITTNPCFKQQMMGAVAGAVQPVWFIVQVPKDAKVGTYTGTITVNANGEKTISTPIEVRVASDWVMPDPGKFRTYMGLLQSPDSVALQYKVPMWSDEHWKKLDKTMDLLGQLGNREIYIMALTKTAFGNEHSMIRWVKKADGKYVPDLSIAEKYLDLAVKHKWNISVTCLYLSDGIPGGAMWYDGKPRDPATVTAVDPATGALSELQAPKWGTPESQAFWKPVVDGMNAILEKRGLKNTLMFGFVVQNQVRLETIADLKALAPDTKWVEFTHWSMKRKGNKEIFQDIGRMGFAFGAPLNTFWNPDEEKSCYNWRNQAKDVYFIAGPRAKAQIAMGQTGELSVYRLTCETTMLSGVEWQGLGAMCGFGQVGADFWPLMASKTEWDPDSKRIFRQYVNWGSLTIEQMFSSLLGAGTSMPTHTCRSQMLRESLQEADVRMYVQDAVLDSADKLGPELTAECKKICDDRSRTFFYCALYFADTGRDYGRIFSQDQWDAQTEKLYLAAAKVQKALGK